MKRHNELTAQETSAFREYLHEQASGSQGQDALEYYKILSAFRSIPECDRAVKLLGWPTDEEINSMLNFWLENKEESI
jgi:hypothetical protein